MSAGRKCLDSTMFAHSIEALRVENWVAKANNTRDENKTFQWKRLFNETPSMINNSKVG